MSDVVAFDKRREEELDRDPIRLVGSGPGFVDSFTYVWRIQCTRQAARPFVRFSSSPPAGRRARPGLFFNKDNPWVDVHGYTWTEVPCGRPRAEVGAFNEGLVGSLYLIEYGTR